MSLSRSTIIYSIFALLLFCTSIYSMYIFAIDHSIFFHNNSLLIPYMQRVPFVYTAWTLPTHYMLFPDALLYSIVSLITDITKERIALYTIAMVILTYITLISTLQKRIGSTLFSLYILIWTMVLLLYFFATPFIAQIFLPNGLLGFFILYILTIHAIYKTLYTKHPLLSKIFLPLLFIGLTFVSPMLTFILLAIPALCLSFIQRKREYPTEKHLHFDITITLSTIFGFLLQLYILPSKQLFTPTLPYSFSTILDHIPLGFILLALIGLLYAFFFAFSKTHSLTTSIMRMACLGISLGALLLPLGILDSTLYIAFVLLFTILYAIPHGIVTLISLFTMSRFYSINTVCLLAIVCILITLYLGYHSKTTLLPSKAIITYLEESLPSNTTHYILAPRDIANEITVLNNSNIIAIPYIPNTLEYTSFIPDDSKITFYSTLIIEKEFENTILIQQLFSLIGTPTRTTTIGDYIVMEFTNGFTMPNAGKLATYTTPLGNIIRNSIQEAPLIPLPPNFSSNGIPIKEIRLLQSEKKIFIALIFSKDSTLPINAEYSAYTLSPSSSAFRKLASGIRRELPFLSSVLPLEDKNTEYVHSTKDMYILQNGDSVVAIDVTAHVKESLTFLSISIENSSPTIVFQYPTPPIVITK